MIEWHITLAKIWQNINVEEKKRKVGGCLASRGDDDIRIAASNITNCKIYASSHPNYEKTKNVLHSQKRRSHPPQKSPTPILLYLYIGKKEKKKQNEKSLANNSIHLWTPAALWKV